MVEPAKNNGNATTGGMNSLVVNKVKNQVYIPRLEVYDDGKDRNEVSINIFRNGDTTISEAWIDIPWGKNGDVKTFITHGATTRYEKDKEHNGIAEGIAISRAIKKLASLMLQTCMDEVHERCNGEHNKFNKMTVEELKELRAEIDDTIKHKKDKERIRETLAKKYKEEAVKTVATN